MKKTIILLLFVFSAFIAVSFLVGKKEDKTSSTEVKTETLQVGKYKTEVNSEASVTVEVTPLVISTEKNTSFSVAINTHSVALDKDLKEISVLLDDKGNKYKPVSWDGGVGGHHLEGKLIFPSILAGAKEIKLTIYGIGKIDRVFSWKL